MLGEIWCETITPAVGLPHAKCVSTRRRGRIQGYRFTREGSSLSQDCKIIRGVRGLIGPRQLIQN